MIIITHKDQIMPNSKMYDCYLDSNEIIELMKILNSYLVNYADEIPEIYTTSVLAKTIQTRCEILTDNIDEICATLH